MRLVAPNGAEVDARDDAVRRLLDCGFSPVERPKPAPKRRAPRKAQKPQEKQ